MKKATCCLMDWILERIGCVHIGGKQSSVSISICYFFNVLMGNQVINYLDITLALRNMRHESHEHTTQVGDNAKEL